jgi:hypothetical protein
MPALRSLLVTCGALLVLLASPGRAGAQDPAHDKQLAIDLFDSGVQKMREGGCDRSPLASRPACEQARDAFARAYSLYPAGLGALRNLAYVEQNLGLLASAARHFRELARRAPLDPNPARKLWAEFARKEAEKLTERIPRLTLRVPVKPPDTTVELDGHVIPEAAWGTAIEVDPGEHTLRAAAPGHASFSETLTLAEGERKELEAPLKALAVARPSSPAPLPLAAQADAPVRPRVLPLVVAGAGIATLTAGLGLGYVAIQKRKDACGDGHYCDREALESGRRKARASTIVTVAGGALTASGLVWYFLLADRSKGGSRAALRPLLGGATGIEASGSF